MASDTALQRNDDGELRVRWSRRLSLRQRILAVNLLALVVLATSLIFIDSFRSGMTQARVEQAKNETAMVAETLAVTPPERWPPLLASLGRASGTRLRVYDRTGALRADSWSGALPTYELRDPASEPWYRDVARALDDAVDWLVGALRAPDLAEPARDRLEAWPEAVAARAGPGVAVALRRAPEGTDFVTAASQVSGTDAVILLSVNAREIRRAVRAERFTLFLILLGTLMLSILLSRFLARTIANPLRRLAFAAHRVRLGRAREVDVPVLPARRDEIGLLARALHDMTQSLRQRIDSTEAFAADVTHELKNPLASLRSAVDSLERIDDPGLRRQLLDVVRDDVARLDRLVVDIAEASRLDAELSRARFEPVDLGRLIESLIGPWEERTEKGVQIAYARPRVGSAIVLGDESRLARLLDNLVDNAISFSPTGGLVEIRAMAAGEEVLVSIEDEGPGVPGEAREAIFARFHSMRPDSDFGRHSGLGLAIARAIVDGHGGSIHVEDRRDGGRGARFVVRFGAAGA